MKIKIVIFLLLLSNSIMFAQPWFTNGNTIVPGDYLGTTNNQALNIRTNSLSRMHINENLNFSPGYLGSGVAYTTWLALNYPAYGVVNGNGFVDNETN